MEKKNGGKKENVDDGKEEMRKREEMESERNADTFLTGRKLDVNF